MQSTYERVMMVVVALYFLNNILGWVELPTWGKLLLLAIGIHSLVHIGRTRRKQHKLQRKVQQLARQDQLAAREQDA